MALTPGTRLGVYEIAAKIGEGGMGQVYRARDTRLDRDVAIKILPEAFAPAMRPSRAIGPPAVSGPTKRDDSGLERGLLASRTAATVHPLQNATTTSHRSQESPLCQ